MAIQVYCPRCRSSYKLGTNECPKCSPEHGPFGKTRKYRVYISARGKTFTKYYDSLTLAREAAAAIKADILRGNLDINQKDKPVPTLREVWAKYLVWAKSEKSTWDDDMFNYQKHLEPRFGKKHLDAISAMDVNRLKQDMTKGKTKEAKLYLSKRDKLFSASTIKHQLVLLKRLYKFAQGPDFKYTGPTPFDHKQVAMPHLDNELPRFLTEEQLAALWDTLETWPDKMTVAFIKFALLTGVRRGTLFMLTWKGVDFERDMVTLTISHRRKGNETIAKKVCPEAMECLKPLPRTSEYVFPGKGGGQRTDFKGPWRRIRKAASLPDSVRFHDLRHTFGSYHAMNETTLQVLQQLMNHRDFRTTLKYAHLSPGVVNERAAKSGELFIPRKAQDKVIALTED
jgi:integrase